MQVKRSGDAARAYAPDPHLGGRRDHSLRARLWSGCKTAAATSGTTIFICAECARKTASSKQQIEQMRLRAGAAERRCCAGTPLAEVCWRSKNSLSHKTVAAQVIGSSGSDLSRIIYIDKGDERRHQAGYGSNYRGRHRGQGSGSISYAFRRCC